MKQSTRKFGRIAKYLGSRGLSKLVLGACVVTLGAAVSLSPSADHFVAISSPVQAKENKGTGPADMSADDVAKRVQKFYKKTEDYHAHFEQTYTDVAAGSKKKSQGRVYFKKPGKMRWDYYKDDGKGRKKVLVSDGESFWIYEYEFKQVFKKCLASSQLPTSLKFLMGQGDLLKEFNVSFADSSTAKKPVLEMVPKQPTSKYTKLIFELDPKTFQVDQTTIYDPYGNTNSIEFNKAKINKNLPDSGFNFEIPKGARVLNPQKKCSTPSTSSSGNSADSKTDGE